MLNFCDFILVYVFTTNHHFNANKSGFYTCSQQIGQTTEKYNANTCRFYTYSNHFGVVGCSDGAG